MQVNSTDLVDMLQQTLQAGLVPMIHGSPAIGKSDIVRQVADKFNMEVVDFRLSQADPADMNGFPAINEERTKSGYLPMDTFPIEGDPLPKGKDGWLLFLDEINSAPLSVQAASYKLVLDRMIGRHNIHEKVVMVAAGNLATDKAIVQRLSTAMQSRLAHYELVVDPKAWTKWAIKAKIDHRIISFISFKPEILYNFRPDHNGNTFASPRTWEFTHKLLKPYPDQIPASAIPLLAAVIDEAAAREFYSYCQIFESLVTIAQIKAAPSTCEVPTEPSIQYALSGSIAQALNESNATDLMTFLSRMGIEFQVLCLQQAFVRDKALLHVAVIKSWISKNSKDLF